MIREQLGSHWSVLREQLTSGASGREVAISGANEKKRMTRYRDVYQGWLGNPEGFWAEAATAVDWFKQADRVFDAGAGAYGRWFVGAECNTAQLRARTTMS